MLEVELEHQPAAHAAAEPALDVDRAGGAAGAIAGKVIGGKTGAVIGGVAGAAPLLLEHDTGGRLPFVMPVG